MNREGERQPNLIWLQCSWRRNGLLKGNLRTTGGAERLRYERRLQHWMLNSITFVTGLMRFHLRRRSGCWASRSHPMAVSWDLGVPVGAGISVAAGIGEGDGTGISVAEGRSRGKCRTAQALSARHSGLSKELGEVLVEARCETRFVVTTEPSVMQGKSESACRLGSGRMLRLLVRRCRIMISLTNAVRSLLVSMSSQLVAPALVPGGGNLKTKHGAPGWRRDGSGRKPGADGRSRSSRKIFHFSFIISHLTFTEAVG